MSTSAPCICLFSALYLPSLGGVETYTSNLGRELLSLGWRVVVVTYNTHNLPARENNDGIEVVRLPTHKLLNGRYPVQRTNHEARNLWAWLNDQSIDAIVVNTRFYTLSKHALSFAAKKSIIPLLIEHGSAHLTMGNTLVDKVVECVEHFTTHTVKQFPSACYAVSKKASNWLSHFTITSQGELPNAINADEYLNHASSRNFLEEFDIKSDSFIVAFVGRFVKEKGVLELAQAAQQLPANEDITVLIAGDGPLQSSLEKFQGEHLHLVGRLDRTDVGALLQQADVLCLPSRSEGFATSLLEAAACYTPAIVTNVGGTDELIPSEEFGVIIPNREPQTIAIALRSAASNHAKTATQGKNVGKLVREGFSWAATAKKTLVACQSTQNEIP